MTVFQTSGLEAEKVLVETLHLSEPIPFPSGLAFHPIRKSLFVTSRDQDQRWIYEVEPQTGQVRKWKSGGSIYSPPNSCSQNSLIVSCSRVQSTPEDIPSITIDSQGYIYLSFSYSNLGLFSLIEGNKSQVQQIKLISPDSFENPIIGVFPSNDQSKFKDEALKFKGIKAITLDHQGNIFLIDGGNSLIRKIMNNFVYNVAGNQTLGYGADGQASQVSFGEPFGITLNQTGDIFITDRLLSNVRKISIDGQVSTFAGSQTLDNLTGFKDGKGTSARFKRLTSIILDQANNLYVSDTDNQAIRKITPEGVVSTLAGQPSPMPTKIHATPLPYNPSLIDGPGTDARFHSPIGLALDDQGVLYVADRGNHAIRRIKPIGEQKK